MNASTQMALDALVKVAALVVAFLVTRYTPVIVSKITTSVHNATARSALVFLTTLVSRCVAAEAQHVRDLKDPLKPGTWSKEAASAALNKVIEQVKAAAPGQIKIIEDGLSAGQSVDSTLRTLIEADVEMLRRYTPSESTTQASGAQT